MSERGDGQPRSVSEAIEFQEFITPKDGFRLNEAEILLAAQMAGHYSSYDKPYEQIASGAQLTLREIDRDDNATGEETTLRIDRLQKGTVVIEDAPGEPSTKLFEATVISSNYKFVEVNSEIFGVFLPNGFGAFVDSAPDSDLTNRRILAMLAYNEAERQSAA